ncbi:MAG: hypothetical protein EBZ48_00085 [Proteobacteria bacterium]|nr:hypothetical protein [Pseudomonadota bacterium]
MIQPPLIRLFAAVGKYLGALTLLAFAALHDAPTFAWAQGNAVSNGNQSGQPVSVKMVVDSVKVSSGAVITPGVQFTIPDNWHIYGQSPGKIGLPTKVTYTAPPGFDVGEIQWPPNKTFEQPGGFTGYGYEREVLLAAPVQIPDKLPAGEKFEIQAEVRWLSCFDRCIPGYATLSQEFIIAE